MEKKNIKIISRSGNEVCGLCNKRVTYNFKYSYIFSEDIYEACIACLSVVMGLSKIEEEILISCNIGGLAEESTRKDIWDKNSLEYKLLLECAGLEDQDKIFHSISKFKKSDVFGRFLKSIESKDSFFNSKKNEMVSLVSFFNDNRDLILKARDLALDEVNNGSSSTFFVDLYSIARFRSLSDKQKACIIGKSGSGEFDKFELMRKLLNIGLKEIGIPENSNTNLWFDIMRTVCGLRIERMSAKQESYVNRMLVKYDGKIKAYFNSKGIYIDGYNTMNKV